MTTKTLHFILFIVIFLSFGKLLAQREVMDAITLANGGLQLSDDVSGTNDFDNPLIKYQWYFIKKYGINVKPTMGLILYSFSPTLHNDCNKFFLDTLANKNAKFSTVSAYLYKSEDYRDSLMNHKKLVSKCIMNFNQLGQITFEKILDSKGKITDSTRMKYNSSNNLIRRTKYAANDTEKMRRIWDEFYVWDNKGRIIKYMSLSHPSFQNKEFDSTFLSVVYDDLNYTETITSKDDIGSTLYTLFKYDNHHRVVQFRWWGEHAQTADDKYKYDSVGNLTEELLIRGNDTTWRKYAYNRNNFRISEEEHTNDSDSYKLIVEFLPDGERVETTDVVSFYTKMCFRNRFEQKHKTITRYDKDSNILSETEIGEEDYKPYNKNTIHKYHFKGKRVLLDSAIITEKYKHDSIMYVVNKYDSNGNRIEDNGINWNGKTKETWKYNRANKILEHRSYYTNQDEQYGDGEDFEYYEDSVSLKKHRLDRSNNYFSAIATFEKNSRIKTLRIDDIDYLQYVYEYK